MHSKVPISFRLCVFQPLSVNFVDSSTRTVLKTCFRAANMQIQFHEHKLNDHTILIIAFQSSSLLVVAPA